MAFSSAPFGSSSGFTVDQQRKIVEAVGKKIRPFCAACGHSRTFHLVGEGIINMPITQPPSNLTGLEALYGSATYPGFPGRNLPCIALMCSNCGLVQFHSVIQLGLGPLLGVSPNPPMLGGI